MCRIDSKKNVTIRFEKKCDNWIGFEVGEGRFAHHYVSYINAFSVLPRTLIRRCFRVYTVVERIA